MCKIQKVIFILGYINQEIIQNTEQHSRQVQEQERLSQYHVQQSLCRANKNQQKADML
jgi:hypothetical protein